VTRTGLRPTSALRQVVVYIGATPGGLVFRKSIIAIITLAQRSRNARTHAQRTYLRSTAAILLQYSAGRSTKLCAVAINLVCAERAGSPARSRQSLGGGASERAGSPVSPWGWIADGSLTYGPSGLQATRDPILQYLQQSMSVQTPEDWVVLYVLLYRVVLYYMVSCGIVLYGTPVHYTVSTLLRHRVVIVLYVLTYIITSKVLVLLYI